MDLKKNLHKKRFYILKFDWMLFLFTLCVSVFGIFMVYSATRSFGTNSNVINQTVSWVIGSVGMIVLCFFDYEQFENMIVYIAVLNILMLLGVLVFGITGGWGARSWIRIGGFGLQPAEFAKIGFIITFSYHLSKVCVNINKPFVLLGLALHVAVPVALILLQPDAGSAMVFLFMFFSMMFTAKLSYRYILPIILVGILSLPVMYKFFLDEFQQRRIQVFLNPELDPVNGGYNVLQSKIAVGSGGFWGKGFLNGTQNMMEYLPSKHTDFIFSVISEEFGFLGSVLVTVVLFFIILKCFKIAKNANGYFGKFICTGVGGMLLFHTFENIGMCIGLMPVTGIPLPFISYGGTALITNLFSVGLVMGVNYHNKAKTVFEIS